MPDDQPPSLAERRVARLEDAIWRALNRLEPFAETHPRIATIVDALRAALDRREP